MATAMKPMLDANTISAATPHGVTRLQVLRFDNDLVIDNPDHVYLTIEASILTPPEGGTYPMNPTFLLWLGAAMATFLGAATVSRAYIDSGKLWVLLPRSPSTVSAT